MDSNKHLRMVIIVRKDLKMPKGKAAAQVGHAVQMLLLSGARIYGDGSLQMQLSPEMMEWLSGDYTKIVLGVNSEEELESIHLEAMEAGLSPVMVIDKGFTCFNGKETATAIAFGPLTSEEHDGLTGHLSLLQ
jgi:peptidyl-tRNA hydrolase, PTH2 family